MTKAIFYPISVFNSLVYRTIQCTFNCSYGLYCFFSVRIMGEAADLGKRGTTEVRLCAAQNFLSQVTGLSDEIYFMASVVTKRHTIDRCKYLWGLLLVGNKTEFASWRHWFTCNRNVVFLAVTCDFYSLSNNCRYSNLLYVPPYIRLYQGDFHWRDFHVI